MTSKKERQARCKPFDIETGSLGRRHIGDAVGQGKGDFLHCGTAGFAHVVATNRNGVPLGDALGTIGKGVSDEPHRGAGWKNIRPAGGIFFENVVLDGATEGIGRHALAFGGQFVQQQQHGGRCIDGHRGGDFVEGDLVKQRQHVVEAVDGHAHFADFAFGSYVV